MKSLRIRKLGDLCKLRGFVVGEHEEANHVVRKGALSQGSLRVKTTSEGIFRCKHSAQGRVCYYYLAQVSYYIFSAIGWKS